ncbi:MAG: DUF47 family protein [Saprospiraceae bacterium]
MSLAKPSIATKLINRIFPPSINFFGMLNDQIDIVLEMAELMVDYMENNSVDVGGKIFEKENEVDKIQAKIIVELNEAFSTPVDREDIYRAVMGIEAIANYYKATISEIQLFDLKPTTFDFDMVVRLRDGVQALKSGFALLSKKPMDAIKYCDQVHWFGRKIEHIYRQALVELFTHEDFKYIFKRREVYRHLSGAAERLLACANNLQDIIVKTT